MRSISSILNFVTGDKVIPPFPQQNNGNKYLLPAAPASSVNSFSSNSFAHRDGQGGGWGQAGGHGGGGGAPAISALALLGFLFFLNLIQNSLLLNRQLMTTTVVTTANASASASASAGTAVAVGRNEKVTGNSTAKAGGRSAPGTGNKQYKNGTRTRRLRFRPKRSLSGRIDNHIVDFLKEKYFGMSSTLGDMDIAAQISRYKIPNVKEPRMPLFPLLPPTPSYSIYNISNLHTSNKKFKPKKKVSQPTNKPPDQIENPLAAFFL